MFFGEIIKRNNLLLCLLLGVIAVASFYAVSKKEGFFLDEVYTFELSNKQYITWGEFREILQEGDVRQYKHDFWDFDANGVYDRDAFVKKLYISDQGAFNYFNVIVAQTMDVHPPLYYFVIHTVSSITRSSNLLMIGFGVNLFFLLLTCFFVYRIACQIFSDRYRALLPVLFYGFSYAFMNSVTYFRMYCLLSFLFTLLVYLYLQLQANGWRLEKRILWGICIVEFLAMYTQFFSLFFLLPIFLFALYGMRADVAALKKFVIAHVLTGLAFLLLWPQIFLQIMEGSTQKDAAESLSFVKGIKDYVWVLNKSLFDGFGMGIVLFVLLVAVLLFQLSRSHRGNLNKWVLSLLQSRLMLLLFPSLVFFLGVSTFSPWVDFRYLSPVLPALSLLIITLVWKALSQWIRNEKVVNASLLAFVLLLSLGWVKRVPLEHLYPETEEKKQFESTYGGLEAVIFDYETPSVFIDVPLKYAHPKYINTDERNMMKNDFLGKTLVNDSYVLYLSHFCDIQEVGPILTQLHYDYELIPFKAEFHNVYLLKRIQLQE